MQKRKFDELISHFNRKVSDMSIDQKYKMELLGMISAIGFAHEKELSTNLAEVGTDCISRQQAINALDECYCGGEDSCGEPWVYKENAVEAIQMIEPIPSAEPKRGKWICTGEPDESWGMMYECSICGNHDYGGNYCSYCGAKMEDSEDETD